jgi:hypothetical protein
LILPRPISGASHFLRPIGVLPTICKCRQAIARRYRKAELGLNFWKIPGMQNN